MILFLGLILLISLNFFLILCGISWMVGFVWERRGDILWSLMEKSAKKKKMSEDDGKKD